MTKPPITPAQREALDKLKKSTGWKSAYDLKCKVSTLTFLANKGFIESFSMQVSQFDPRLNILWRYKDHSAGVLRGTTEVITNMRKPDDNCVNIEDYLQDAVLLEKLADLEHNRWSRWMIWMFDNWTEENIGRWKKQMYTPYVELPEYSKESDRKEARHTIEIILKHITED